MPSSRRTKQLAIIGVVVIIFLIWLSRDTTTQTFYTRTVKALDAKRLSDEQAASKLRTIKDASKGGKPVEGGDGAQKPLADSEGSDSPAESKEDAEKKEDEGEGDGDKSVAGRKKMKNPKSKEERLAEAEMNQILKRSPVIIFSKTWCPYSAKAKRILTDKYAITPRPHIVELDKHALGAALQNLLDKKTGRRTVPNILINGKSIGGGDDIEAKEIANTLQEQIQSMGGKRITKIQKLREVGTRRNNEKFIEKKIVLPGSFAASGNRLDWYRLG